MSKKGFTDMQERYITMRLAHPEMMKTEIAKKLNMPVATIYNWPKSVEAEIRKHELEIREHAKGLRTATTLKAAAAIMDLLESEDLQVKFKAAQYILDHELGKAPIKTEVTGSDGKPIQYQDLTGISDEQLRAIAILSDLEDPEEG